MFNFFFLMEKINELMIPTFLLLSPVCVGLFGGRGRGMSNTGRGQQLQQQQQPPQQDKKPGKPQGMKNQH